MATRPLLRLSLVLVALIAFVAPGVAAQVDERIHADAADCLDARGVDPSAPEARQATCVVAYAHFDWRAGPYGFLAVERPPNDAPDVEAGWAGPALAPFIGTNLIELPLKAGNVRYADSSPSSYNERLRLDVANDVAWQATAFLTVDQTLLPQVGLGDPSPALGVGALPCLKVRVEVVSDEYDRVTVLSSAETITHVVRPSVPVPDVCGADEAAVMHPDGVTEVTLDLPAIEKDIETDERIILRWSVHMIDAAGNEVMPHGIRWLHGPERPIRVVIPVEDAIRIEKVAPTWHDGLLYVLVDSSSPWGQHDVDLETVRLDILDEREAVVASSADGSIGPPIVRYAVEHGPRPLALHYIFDLLATPLPYGDYTLRVTAENGQHTGRAIVDATFSWEGGLLLAYGADGNLTSSQRLNASEEATFPALIPALGAAALVAVVLRRRAPRT